MLSNLLIGFLAIYLAIENLKPEWGWNPKVFWWGLLVLGIVWVIEHAFDFLILETMYKRGRAGQ